MHRDVEAEFKLRATRDLEVAVVDAAVREAGFRVHDPKATRHVDVYLDSAEGSLRRAGIGLRLRNTDGALRMTCKTRGQRNGSLFVRHEWESTWPQAEPPRRAADLPAPLRDAVEPFVLDHPLQAVLQLATRRDHRALQCDRRDLCELAIDRVEATAAGRSAAFCEVEIEVLDDLPTCERLADRLLQGLPLQAADDDKPGHASALLGLQQAPPRATPVTAATDIGVAVATIAAPHLVTMQQAEVSVRRDDGPDHLHAMRVAVRRLREIVRGFGSLWDKAERTWLVAHLAETGRRLGALRDLDVVLADLPPAIEHLPAALRRASPAVLDWVGQRRRHTCEQLLAWLRSDARLADQRRLFEAFASHEARPAAATVAEVLPRRLAKAVRKVRKLAAALPAELPLEPLHRLRIACKRLRYLAEEFAALPGLDYEKSLAEVVRLQQALGAVCDHEVATRRLLEWIHPAAAAIGDNLNVAALLGGLASRAALAADAARMRAARRLARTHRKKVYRRFRSSLDTDVTLAS
ncbi:MAG: CHAD domain-containing protein [Planctomycetes bacterium]|nr:CHAD domain-containing protein [Planctomycetota bacterium]